MEYYAADIESALKGFTSFRRTYPDDWKVFRVTTPNGAVVSIKMFGKKTIQRLEVERDGNVMRFNSIWDGKVSQINSLVREALEAAYA